MGRQLEAHHRISDTSPHELTGPAALWETEQASAPQATGERPPFGTVRSTLVSLIECRRRMWLRGRPRTIVQGSRDGR